MSKGTSLLLPLLFVSTLAVGQVSDADKIAALENDIALLKSANQNNAFDRVNFNGFYSFGVTRASNDIGYADSKDSYSFDELTLIGLQGEFSLGENTSVVAQILAKGSDDFDMSMEWAYLKHTFENDITVRGGKLRVPLFMYSDYLDVGFTQPWVRPPLETYVQVPFSSYVGADIAYDIEFSESVISLQAFGGQSTSTRTETVDLTSLNAGKPDFDYLSEFDYMWGSSIAWNYDSLTLRGVYGTTVASSNHPIYAGVLGEGSRAQFYGAGLQYDNGDYLVVSEYTSTEIEGMYPDVTSYYATLGYRFGDFMPYVNYANAKSQDDSERVIIGPNGFDGQRTAYSVGLRYELLWNLALKADLTYVTDMDGSAGFLAGNAVAREDDTTVYSLRIDGVF